MIKASFDSGNRKEIHQILASFKHKQDTMV